MDAAASMWNCIATFHRLRCPQMGDTGLDVVTGAFSYTGAAIARLLLDQGRRVRTLTGHPNRHGPGPSAIEAFPYRFDDLAALRSSLGGATTLYNTYWIRFGRGDITFRRAIENSGILFAAARDAGVEQIVHVSVSKPSPDSPFPYFRGKALVELALADVGVARRIIRPTIIFGPGDILINNIAWLLRRIPAFAIPGTGSYRVRPVHVDDVAATCVDSREATEGTIVDAVGPKTMTFETMVRRIRSAVGSRAVVLHAPIVVAHAAARVISAVVRDVLVTDHELGGLMAELATTDGPATGGRRFSEWLREHGQALGRRYASEVERHFDAS
jgi:uncharacterized protein YbjT (DUF2867 family)